MTLWNCDIFAKIFNYDQLFRYSHFCLLDILCKLVGAMV